jgi:hypothetical protein
MTPNLVVRESLRNLAQPAFTKPTAAREFPSLIMAQRSTPCGALHAPNILIDARKDQPAWWSAQVTRWFYVTLTM